MNHLPIAARSIVAAPEMSSRYVHIDTGKVIDILGQEGYVVAEVKSDKARMRDPRFVRHEIDFRHPDHPKLDDGSIPRFLFRNSHNGTTRALFVAGMFRFICGNGLVVGTALAQVKVQHTGDLAREIIDRIRETSKQIVPVMNQVGVWQRKTLAPAAQLEFAKKAAELRFGELLSKGYKPADLLVPRRDEDKNDDVWSVFNRVQENAVKGGLNGQNANGRRITARGLSGIGQSAVFNAALWQLAAETAA